jgi:Zn finger protein HypA/HybF involved in hydrogenase expression
MSGGIKAPKIKSWCGMEFKYMSSYEKHAKHEHYSEHKGNELKMVCREAKKTLVGDKRDYEVKKYKCECPKCKDKRFRIVINDEVIWTCAKCD